MSQLQSQAHSTHSTNPKTSGVLCKIIPVQITEMSTFDDSFSFLKERFAAEMRRMDDEMNKFSVDLTNLYGGSSSTAPATISWEELSSSPLISGEGEETKLKLQFDLSQFEPKEIKVLVADNVLTVSAEHFEENDTTSVKREFQRKFLLPKGTNANLVSSMLSRDGVLNVQAQLPELRTELDKTFLAVQEEDPSKTIVNPELTAIETIKAAEKEDSVKKMETSKITVNPETIAIDTINAAQKKDSVKNKEPSKMTVDPATTAIDKINAALKKDSVKKREPSKTTSNPEMTAKDTTNAAEKNDSVKNKEPSKIVDPEMTTEDATTANEKKDSAKKIEPSTFEQKRASEHKKAQDQKSAHELAKDKKSHDKKALDINKGRRQPSSQSQDAPQRGTSRLSKSKK